MASPKNPTVKLGLHGQSAGVLVEKGRTNVKMMTNNPVYVGPTTPPLPSITTACDNLEISILDVQFNGGKLAHELKRTRERKLIALIKELAGYVQANCQGSVENVLSAGFEVRASGKPVEKLGMPENLRPLLTDFAGEVPLRWNKVKDAVNYQVFANNGDPAKESDWELVAFTSKTRYTVEALESAKFYWFRVQALGRKGLASPMSEPVRALAA